ncbi:hypothetical protein LB505_014235 [Fusarium chuoi]|nr:hypothetical protein LB505_014235 [Fusarium chuoi]
MESSIRNTGISIAYEPEKSAPVVDQHPVRTRPRWSSSEDMDLLQKTFRDTRVVINLCTIKEELSQECPRSHSGSSPSNISEYGNRT